MGLKEEWIGRTDATSGSLERFLGLDDRWSPTVCGELIMTGANAGGAVIKDFSLGVVSKTDWVERGAGRYKHLRRGAGAPSGFKGDAALESVSESWIFMRQVG